MDLHMSLQMWPLCETLPTDITRKWLLPCMCSQMALKLRRIWKRFPTIRASMSPPLALTIFSIRFTCFRHNGTEKKSISFGIRPKDVYVSYQSCFNI